MKGKIFQSLSFAAVIIILISPVWVFFGCSQESHGTFYSLEDAYELNYITKEDLKNIAYYHNNAHAFPETLSNETEKAIKETVCERLRDEYGIENASTDGVGIVEFCGVYNEYYAVALSDIYISTPTDVPYFVIEIDGVEICYTGYFIIEIWCAKSA